MAFWGGFRIFSVFSQDLRVLGRNFSIIRVIVLAKSISRTPHMKLGFHRMYKRPHANPDSYMGQKYT